MKFLFYACATLGCFLSTSYAGPVTAPSAQYYRDLTLQIRKSGQFALSFPGTQSTIEYYLEYGHPVYKEPILFDSHLNGDKKYFRRLFWDRILVKDGSFVTVNGEKIPLTCVVISGQDNRFEEKNNISPLLPEFVLKIFFVANDFSCQGPLKPGWPETGGREENWDTYLYYEIKDPTIMLPVEAKMRYKWNEFNVTLVDKGGS